MGPQNKHLLELKLAAAEVPVFLIVEFELWAAGSDSDEWNVDAI